MDFHGSMLGYPVSHMSSNHPKIFKQAYWFTIQALMLRNSSLPENWTNFYQTQF